MRTWWAYPFVSTLARRLPKVLWKSFSARLAKFRMLASAQLPNISAICCRVRTEGFSSRAFAAAGKRYGHNKANSDPWTASDGRVGERRIDSAVFFQLRVSGHARYRSSPGDLQYQGR